MHLPTRDYKGYCGIDPGNDGAIGLMDAAGTSLYAWDMPTVKVETGREYDLVQLKNILRHIQLLHLDVCIGIEWPVSFPGAFHNVARDAENFGRGKGYLEAFAFLLGFDYFRIAPTLWKGRLGLDGKTVEGANTRAAALFDTFYPGHGGLIRGKRGGLHDGPLDALLMAHLLRTRGSNGIKATAETFGKDSPEMMALMLGSGRRKKKMNYLTRP